MAVSRSGPRLHQIVARGDRQRDRPDHAAGPDRAQRDEPVQNERRSEQADSGAHDGGEQTGLGRLHRTACARLYDHHNREDADQQLLRLDGAESELRRH